MSWSYTEPAGDFEQVGRHIHQCSRCGEQWSCFEIDERVCAAENPDRECDSCQDLRAQLLAEPENREDEAYELEMERRMQADES